MVRRLIHEAERADPTVFTVGHSTRAIEEFRELLEAHEVKHLIDVRTVPRSRTNPQFNRDTLPERLKLAGIAYSHMPELSGLRHAKPDSRNTGWRNKSFRGYADYMQTTEFAKALEKLIAFARKNQIAVMCAEAVPWRCHRSLIGDALLGRGIPVEHVMSSTRRDPHNLTPFAEARGTRVTYPSRQPGEQPGKQLSLLD